jgi:hypothetical protein
LLLEVQLVSFRGLNLGLAVDVVVEELVFKLDVVAVVVQEL